MTRLKSLSPAVSLLVVVVVVIALAVVFWPGAPQNTLTAYFPRAISLYPGSDVKILGIPVGRVDAVVPEGTRVKVTMTYASKYPVPANVKAAIISPAVVGDRFVQLTPAYRSGPKLADNAVLGVKRTAVPLELDQIFAGINQLDVALGPQGANRHGALTNLLNTTAANFGGQGPQFNRTVKNLGRLTQTLADNKDALFGTAKKVEVFVNALARNNTTVRQFNDALASGSQVLAGQRHDLAAAMHNLGTALLEVRGFVHHNRALLGSNIRGLDTLSQILVKRRAAVNETLQVAPDALNNLYLAYDPASGTLDTRDNAGQLGTQLTTDPAVVLCSFLETGTGAAGRAACQQITSALSTKKSKGGGLKVGGVTLPRAAPFGEASSRPRVLERYDPTFAGILGGAR